MVSSLDGGYNNDHSRDYDRKRRYNHSKYEPVVNLPPPPIYFEGKGF